MPDAPPPLPKRRMPNLPALLRQTRQHPRRWLPLLLWPLAVLGVVLLRVLAPPNAGAVVVALEALLVLSAIAALTLFAVAARRLLGQLRQVRKLLFEGEYESALDLTRHYPAVADGLGLESALVRLLAFDRRRGQKVAAATRLFDRLLRELPLPIFVGILEQDVVRFSRAFCRLLDVANDTYTLTALLVPTDNRHFAYVWDQLASERKTTVNTALTMHLPIAHAEVPLRMRLLSVQNDQGELAYILGIAEAMPEPLVAEDPPADAPVADEPPPST